MIKFLQPLFSETKRTFRYNVPLDDLRSRIEGIFERSGGIFQEPDIRGHFTGGYTFQMESPGTAATGGVIYRSTLYGILRENDAGGTVVETRTRSAISFRVMFWTSIVLGLASFVNQLTGARDQAIWSGIAILILGPAIAVAIANVNNGVIEDRYMRYVHKALR